MRAALTGGAGSVAVGVIAHFTVAFGVAVHLFMNFVVIPLSAIGPRPIVWPTFLAVLAVHLIVVGPSISITVSRLR